MDIVRPHAQYPAEAKIYASRPLNGNAGGNNFGFAYEEPKSRAYARLFSNVTGEDSSIAIRTDERIKVDPGKTYVRLPNGQLYIVVSVLEDFSKAPQQAQRLFAVPFGVVRIMRMKPVDDPWSGQ